jgi:hypothetical protein
MQLMAVRKHLREAHISYWETFLSDGFYKARWVLTPFRVFRPPFVFFAAKNSPPPTIFSDLQFSSAIHQICNLP